MDRLSIELLEMLNFPMSCDEYDANLYKQGASNIYNKFSPLNPKELSYNYSVARFSYKLQTSSIVKLHLYFGLCNGCRDPI